jgi:hypothetical protein
VTDTATTGSAPHSASSDPTTPPYATPVDYDSYGRYGPGRGFDKGKSFRRPVYRFQGRITADGSSGYPAVRCLAWPVIATRRRRRASRR